MCTVVTGKRSRPNKLCLFFECLLLNPHVSRIRVQCVEHDTRKVLLFVITDDNLPCATPLIYRAFVHPAKNTEVSEDEGYCSQSSTRRTD